VSKIDKSKQGRIAISKFDNCAVVLGWLMESVWRKSGIPWPSRESCNEHTQNKQYHFKYYTSY